MPHTMRLRSRQQANCNFALLLQCLSYAIAHFETQKTRICAPKHAHTHPCCACAPDRASLSVSQKRGQFPRLFMVFIALVTLQLFCQAHDSHIVISSALCSNKILFFLKKILKQAAFFLKCKQRLRLRQAMC